MYPPDSVVHLLKPGPGVDQLPSVSTVMSPKIISAKQTCLQWTCTSFSPPKPLPLLPSPPLGACLHINLLCHASGKGSCMGQKHGWPSTFRVSWGYAGGLIEEQKVQSSSLPSFVKFIGIFGWVCIFYVLLYPHPSIVYGAAAASKPFAPSCSAQRM